MCLVLAGVAELAYATDLKSVALWDYGFDSRRRHHIKTLKGWEVLIKLSLDPSRYRVLAQLVRALG